MNSKSYLYRITNTKLSKHYYGSRTCKCDPKDDLGKKYFSSSKDQSFREDQKNNPENYRYKIIIVSNCRKRINLLEEKLHRKFNVGVNPRFYNRTINTESGFNSTGMIVVKDKKENIFRVTKDDPRYLSGELVHITKGTIMVKDKKGNIFRVTKDDPRYLSGELVDMFKGKVVVKDKWGKKFLVSVKDPRWLSGELNAIWTGRKHSKATLEKMKLSHKGDGVGKNNSQYGTCWITNGIDSKKIHKNDPIPEGWRKGRICKKKKAEFANSEPY